jgi:gluconolactonase
MTKTTRRAIGLVATGFACATIATASVGAADFFEGTDPGFDAPKGDASVLPEGAKLMRVFDDGCVLTEGVAAGPDGFMYFSDITFTSACKDESGDYLQAGNIFKYDPQTGETTVFRSPSGMSNGLKFDADGNLIAALGADYGGRMLVKTDMETGRSSS